ncbi:MAG: DoxX family protein [Pseudomonadota bacterium]
MNRLISLHDSIFDGLHTALDGWFLPLFARFTFAAVLLFYFWNSALTKLGDGFAGLFSPSLNAYIQIFPKKTESLGYDASGFSMFDWLIVMAGTYGEFILPALIVVGLFTRIAALGMIIFVVVQSVVDVTGHGVGGADLGGWFDGPSGSLIMDQRLLWVTLFATLIAKGAGALSLDAILKSRRMT